MNTTGEEKNTPSLRRLRVYAFDPGLALHMETTVINEITVSVPFELDTEGDLSSLKRGPVGEYIEVIDYDPASGVCYAPVDLNDPSLLAQDGLSPSEGNPQFHQQMVYAVAMTTIGHFERALGRVVLWAPRELRDANGRKTGDEYVGQLRIYPHALREANAYYSPGKKALLFGYFTTSDNDRDNAPGTMVFTCLSHDIIAHEITHALLDGIHPRFAESTNVDTLALHEAFADIVAVFQHFSNPGVLYNQIARTRGNLASQNLLAKLAVQFGRAMGRSGALRDALGEIDKNNDWIPRQPDARRLDKTTSPHARGAILLAAVFDAFLLIYKTRVADLLRIATQGSGVLPEGEIHPDLVGRMAEEAAKSSRHVLQMCIRALDYCPPVDVTFGDYLRAIITADMDLNPEDDHHYRVAIVEAFRRRGIFPRGVRHLSIDTLCWPGGLEALADYKRSVRDTKPDTDEKVELELDPARRMMMQEDVMFLFDPYKAQQKISKRLEQSGGESEIQSEAKTIKQKKAESKPIRADWDLHSKRSEVFDNIKYNAAAVHLWITEGRGREYIEAFGLTLDENAPPSVYRAKNSKTPSVEIHSVRTALRRGAKGSLVPELVVEITQRRRGYFDPDKQELVDSGKVKIKPDEDGDFKFRRGCTVLIDPKTRDVRRVVRTEGDVSDNDQLKCVRKFLVRESPGDSAFTINTIRGEPGEEAFALLHSNFTQE